MCKHLSLCGLGTPSTHYYYSDCSTTIMPYLVFSIVLLIRPTLTEKCNWDL